MVIRRHIRSIDLSSFHFLHWKKKTHMSTATRVLMAIVLWWMDRRWCGCSWWWYGNRCTTALFHSYWCSCSHIIGKSTPWMPYNRHPINHCGNFFIFVFFSLTPFTVRSVFLKDVSGKICAHKRARTLSHKYTITLSTTKTKNRLRDKLDSKNN